MAQKKVVIVGGGFAGLNAAKTLAKQSEVKVILIDEHNYHLFQPLLYQVATAGLNPADIAVPIRSQFKGIENIEVHLGRVEKVDVEKKTISSGTEELSFDYLILACGAKHSYFGHPEWEKFAPGLKTLEQATEIRRRILLAFEMAENERDAEIQKALMTFVVVGGGPTGVELAGAIADISRTVLKGEFKRIDPHQARVLLVEAGAKILGTFAPTLSAHAVNDLRAIGVELRVNARVENIDEQGVTIGDDKIASRSVFWAAGVQAENMQFTKPPERDRSGKIKVKKDFSLPGEASIFVVGDMASFEVSPQHYLPGLAPVAMQAGDYVASVILRECAGARERREFSYLDKGQLATIGRNRAIAQVKKFKLSGRLAWLAWLFIHVFYLVGFKNRIAVMFVWAWSYLFSKRGSRLIVGPNKPAGTL